MGYYPIDMMKGGDRVRLLVSCTKPVRDAGLWDDWTPVTVERTLCGFTYSAAWGVGAADMSVQPNPGHQGLQAFVQARTGTGNWAVDVVSERDLLKRVYCAIKRATATGARRGGSREALAMARDIIRNGPPKGRYPGQYEGDAFRVWKGHGGSDGATFEAYGEARCRWIEKPESKGLRFVGLAHDVAPRAVDYKGWYLDGYQSETVSGVVYQLPARGGVARYLYGYADPWNTDKDGRGPALLSLNIVEEDRRDSDWDDKPMLRDAARWADDMARAMGEESREINEADEAGRDAREKAQEMRQAGTALVEVLRAGLCEGRAVSALREAYEEAREAFTRALDDMPSREALRDSWREGYDAGAL